MWIFPMMAATIIHVLDETTKTFLLFNEIKWVKVFIIIHVYYWSVWYIDEKASALWPFLVWDQVVGHWVMDTTYVLVQQYKHWCTVVYSLYYCMLSVTQFHCYSIKFCKEFLTLFTVSSLIILHVWRFLQYLSNSRSFAKFP